MGLEDAGYRQGQLDLIEELIGYLFDEHDHFAAYVAIPPGTEALDVERLIVPGATITLEGDAARWATCSGPSWTRWPWRTS